jgi:uncharacterized membrane protein YozB (DUF420 family)
MPGIFGTKAFLQPDINLILQITIIAILAIGYSYKRRGKIRRHAFTMTIGTILHSISFFSFMGPVLAENLNFIYAEISTPLVISIVSHALAGMVVLLLSSGLVIFWLSKFSDITLCFKRKRVMNFVFYLWIISVIVGTIGYLFAYL